ncbi:MAG TPA: hypothetical protein QGI22_00140 [Candidatus Woesearchaeota archaeon]|jgi:hypothetical protein|nr:hypothetical protein [Candidatus Woesearchaeota archaeon]HJN56354.1 hypothetical protein [Candidatus Woesearchaeota archaeon]|tara:strand:+ start:10602 stop:11801 length:1200 start_codon:yes stop_codon:yes gene_type:complete
MNSMKNKRGLSAAGFGIIIGVVILLLSGGTILWAANQSASKLDEKLQVELCRISNEIKFGLEEKTRGVVSGPQICNTIDKTKKKTMVPIKKYSQDKEGVEAEIRDMIQKCWYMWLDGSEGNMFKEYPFTESCFTCYAFTIKDKVRKVTYKDLVKSMEEPFFADDRSDNCAGEAGGFWRTECRDDEKVYKTNRKNPSDNHKCCIQKEITNECGNKGGRCFSEGSTTNYPRIYPKWKCPKRNQNCYVKDDDIYSYTKYIREYGARGGEIYFIPPEIEQKEASDISYNPGEAYAISFVSPSRQYCWKEDPLVCTAMTTAYVAGAVGIGAIIYVSAPVWIPALTVLGAVKASAIGAATAVIIGPKSITNFILKGITLEVPNVILVSTLDHAQKSECTIQYAEK